MATRNLVVIDQLNTNGFDNVDLEGYESSLECLLTRSP